MCVGHRLRKLSCACLGRVSGAWVATASWWCVLRLETPWRAVEGCAVGRQSDGPQGKGGRHQAGLRRFRGTAGRPCCSPLLPRAGQRFGGHLSDLWRESGRPGPRQAGQEAASKGGAASAPGDRPGRTRGVHGQRPPRCSLELCDSQVEKSENTPARSFSDIRSFSFSLQCIRSSFRRLWVPHSPLPLSSYSLSP